MGAADNIALIRRGYEAYMAGDVMTLQEVFAEDVVMTQAGQSPLAGQFKGHQEMFGHFAHAAEFLEGTLQLVPIDITGSDNHVVALLRVSFRKSGRTFEGMDIHVFELRDGRVSSLLAVPDDQYAFDEVLSA